jgi:hypothetical protein
MRTGQASLRWLLAASLLASSSAAGEPPERSEPGGPVSGPAAELGAMQVNGLGPWLAASWQLRRRLVGFLEGHLGLGLAYTFNREAKDVGYGYPAVDAENVDEQRILLVPLDLSFELRFARAFGMTLGGTVGLADNAAKSTYCGTRTYLAGYGAFQAGFAAHFGPDAAYTLGLHAMIASLPQMRCTNGGTDPITGGFGFPHWFIDRDFEPVGGAVSLGLPW